MRELSARIVFSAVFACGFLAAACRHSPPEVSESIDREVHRSPSAPFRLQQATTFAWDSVSIFGPYDMAGTTRDSAGEGWKAALKTGIDARDDIDALVFFHDGRVVDVVEHPRRLGDFDAHHTYSMANAVFMPRINSADGSVMLKRIGSPDSVR